jgi:hypothetical protein
MIPSLEFHLELPDKAINTLIDGFLLIKTEPSKAGTKLLASSGLKNNQFIGSWNLKGRGPLPPSRLLDASGYTMSTQRLWMPQTRGVEGSFFAISPFVVKLHDVSRGDFGGHADARFPKSNARDAGSAGCIVLRRQDHWDVFRGFMENFRDVGIQAVPLLVRY